MATKKRRFELALAPCALRASTSFLVARFALSMQKRCAERLQELGISLQHYAVRCALAEFGKCCNSDLMRWTGIDGPSLIPILNALQERRCVDRDREDADQRRAELKLWSGGSRLRAEAEQALEQAEDEVLRALTGDERATLRELLVRVLDCAD